MKSIMLILAIVAICAAPVFAADQGNVSQSSLAKMGLAKMSVMSDQQGNAVRGMGYSYAYGYSTVNLGHGSYGYNGYTASDAGKNGSLAGGVNATIGGSGNKIVGVGGFSIAFTK